jgi:PIN domain nuclease of toxin-antitoxin system
MKLLLDTHTLIWWFDGSPLLSKKALQAVSDEDNAVFVSAVSAWEISIKERAGRLAVSRDLLEDFDVTIASQNFEALAVSTKHAFQGGRFLARHKDPFDRLLAAQALVEGLTLVSSDQKMPEFGVPILW